MKLICPNCVEVSPEVLVPTKIFPAVPEDPAVPLHPLMVRILPEVQAIELLAEKTKLCAPVPRLIVASLVSAMVDIVSSYPIVEPVENVPPPKLKDELFGNALEAPRVSVPAVSVVVPE